jgi:hypothetical protein
VLLIGGGATLGLGVLALGLVVALSAFNSRVAPTPLATSPNQTSPNQALAPQPSAVTRASPTAANAPVVAGARATAVPTPSPLAATSTPSTPPTPTTTATQPSAAVAPGSRRPLLDARFASGSNGWLDKAPYAAWSDGAYRLRAEQPDQFVAVGAPSNRPLTDVIVTATFRKTGGPPGGGYGMVVRDNGPEPRDGQNQNMKAYVLEAADVGEIGIWRRDGNRWIDLVPWTPSPAVRLGGSPNELSVRAIGDRFSFSVNGVEVAAVQDGTLAAGGVGVFVGGDYNEVALDRFTVQLTD